MKKKARSRLLAALAIPIIGMIGVSTVSASAYAVNFDGGSYTYGEQWYNQGMSEWTGLYGSTTKGYNVDTGKKSPTGGYSKTDAPEFRDVSAGVISYLAVGLTGEPVQTANEKEPYLYPTSQVESRWTAADKKTAQNRNTAVAATAIQWYSKTANQSDTVLQAMKTGSGFNYGVETLVNQAQRYVDVMSDPEITEIRLDVINGWRNHPTTGERVPYQIMSVNAFKGGIVTGQKIPYAFYLVRGKDNSTGAPFEYKLRFNEKGEDVETITRIIAKHAHGSDLKFEAAPIQVETCEPVKHESNTAGVSDVISFPCDGLPKWSEFTATVKLPDLISVTPVAPTLMPNEECGVPGTVVLPKQTGVVYKADGPLTGQGIVKITATPAEGYVFPSGAQTTWSINRGAIKNCEVETVTPVLVPAKTCGVSATIETGPNEGVFYSQTNPSGPNRTVIVTAHPDGGYEIAPGYESTWTIDLGPIEPCDEVIYSVTAPVVIPAQECGVSATIQTTEVNGVEYTIGKPNADRIVNVTAKAKSGFVFDKSVVTSWDLNLGEIVKCPVGADPVPPTVIPADSCGVPSTLNIPKSEGVIYTVDKPNATEGEVVVTATPEEGYEFSDDAVTEWKLDLGQIAPCPTEVTPVAPTLVESNQCNVEPTIDMPNVDGVGYNTKREGNKVTITASPKNGFVFADGADTKWSFDLTPEDCPTVSTEADPSGTAGDFVGQDTANITGNVPDGAYLLFDIYKWDGQKQRPARAEAYFIGTEKILVDGPGKYKSPKYEFTEAGSYQWFATLYSADGKVIAEDQWGAKSERTVVDPPVDVTPPIDPKPVDPNQPEKPVVNEPNVPASKQGLANTGGNSLAMAISAGAALVLAASVTLVMGRKRRSA